MEFHSNEEQELVEKLLKQARAFSFKKGEVVYNEGDQPSGLYFVEEGLVGLIKITHGGAENLLRIFKSGQFFGHRSLFADESYHGSAKCMEDCKLLFCEKKVVLEIFSDNPKAYYFLARALAKELRRAENRSVIVAEGDILERVVSAILLFKKLYPEHPWTRSEIANYCASRTPTVIKTLGKLEEMGVIQQERRKLDILDEDRLVSILNGEEAF